MGFYANDANDSIFNQELTNLARRSLIKNAFIPTGDPSMGGAPPMDPAMAGGAPPMDPAMAGGAPPMDPAMMGGGAPPPPPPPSGGGDIAMMIQTAVQTAIQSSGMGQSGGNQAGGMKPKIDVNVTLLQILKILARIADTLGIKIPASEMVATSGDLTQFAQQQQGSGQQDASMGGGSGGGMGAIPPIPPMEAAGPMKQGSFGENGRAFDSSGIDRMQKKASATRIILSRRAA